MIEYAKCVLPNVCTWETLFRKELLKCYDWTAENEKLALYKWCYANFHHLHPTILEDVFNVQINKSEVQKNHFSKKRALKKYGTFASRA